MTTSTDEAAFFTAIRDNRADDTVRLVYADWLDERNGPGDAERAELIRVQCDLFRNFPTDTPKALGSESAYERWRWLLAREEELLESHGYYVVNTPQVWPVRMTLGARGSRLRVARGFLEWWQMTAADWLQHGDAICAAHPGLERVTLTTWPGVRSNTESGWKLYDGIHPWGETAKPGVFLPGFDPNHSRDGRGAALALLKWWWPNLAIDVQTTDDQFVDMQQHLVTQLTNAMAANLDAQFNTPNIATPTLNVGEWTHDPNATISTNGFDDA